MKVVITTITGRTIIRTKKPKWLILLSGRIKVKETNYTRYIYKSAIQQIDFYETDN